MSFIPTLLASVVYEKQLYLMPKEDLDAVAYNNPFIVHQVLSMSQGPLHFQDLRRILHHVTNQKVIDDHLPLHNVRRILAILLK